MTKEELRTAKIAEGWAVPPVAEWQKMSADGLDPVVYNANNVFNPETEQYDTAVIIVYADGTAQESAVGQDEWKQTFQEQTAAWLLTKEGVTIGGEEVYAVGVDKVYDSTKVVLLTAFMLHTTNGTIREQKYILKYRNGNYDFKPYA